VYLALTDDFDHPEDTNFARFALPENTNFAWSFA
jgi:hypothetical protein